MDNKINNIVEMLHLLTKSSVLIKSEEIEKDRSDEFKDIERIKQMMDSTIYLEK